MREPVVAVVLMKTVINILHEGWGRHLVVTGHGVFGKATGL